MNKPKEITIPAWYKTGHIMYRRDALPIEHPESTYSYIKNVLNLDPLDYGIDIVKCRKCGNLQRV